MKTLFQTFKEFAGPATRSFYMCWVDSQASPTSTSMAFESDSDALYWLEDRIKQDKPTHPIIAAFIFDTKTKKLRRFDINGSKWTEK